jgi:xanthine dehydrogenase YagS FAD-binding subunit
MRPFTYTRATTIEDALHAYAQVPQPTRHIDVRYIGGGTNLIDLMKMGVERPGALVDVSRLALTSIEEHAGGVRVGALTSNTACADHHLIRTRYPVLSQAILAGATQQLRNKATMGGNLMQRTRCHYFYDPAFVECNKRNPGSGCAAKEGVNRMHAILGASEHCIATHPSDMCVALCALDATVVVQALRGSRQIPFKEFHRLPGDNPQFDTNLQPGELITAIGLPPLSYGRRSFYVKVRDRNSYAFALVSAAAILDLDERGVVRKVHLALGGVAHKPWRAEAAERHLTGKKLEPAVIRAAAEVELSGAKPCHDNRFKVELAKRTIVRAVMTAATQA